MTDVYHKVVVKIKRKNPCRPLRATLAHSPIRVTVVWIKYYYSFEIILTFSMSPKYFMIPIPLFLCIHSIPNLLNLFLVTQSSLPIDNNI